MRILLVIENNEYGGGERNFELIIKKINKEKYNIFIACLNSGIFVERIKDYAKIIPLDLSKRINFKNIFYLKKIIEDNKIDIVHSQGARADFYARIAAKISNRSVISSIPMLVEGFNVSFFKKQIYICFDRLTEKFVDKFLVCSKFLFQQLNEKHKIPKEKIEIIPNGVDVKNEFHDFKKINQIKNELGIQNNTLLIGTIGRLVWQKGFEYFIKAIPLVLCSTRKSLKFVIVGDGDKKEYLLSLAKKLNIEKYIVFTGFRKDVEEILYSLDIFVLPSILEGQPFVLLEAMLAGKPIVATDIPGVNETVENKKTALIVPPRSSEALASAILLLLENKDLASQIAKETKRQSLEKYNFDVIIKQYEKVYQEIIIKKKK